MINQDMKRVVDEQRLSYVASVCPDGSPNLSPKGILAVAQVRVAEAALVVSPAYDDGSSEAEIEQRSLHMYGMRRR